MEFLYFLEKIRTPFLDSFFSFLTYFGDETLFIVIALLVFWCADKYEGYYLMITCFMGTVANQFLKITCRIARPWVRNPAFSPVPNAIPRAGGYSFPSGHTQSSVGLFGGLARHKNPTWLRFICLTLCLLVPFSRMYLGVHTPLDVSVAFALGVILVFLLYPLFDGQHKKGMAILILGTIVLTVGFAVYVFLMPFPSEVYLPENIGNLESARKNACSMLGCALGLPFVYYWDETRLHFSANAPPAFQVFKALVGMALVFCVKEGLKVPLEALFPAQSFTHIICYFFVVITAGCFWPTLFTALQVRLYRKEF